MAVTLIFFTVPAARGEEVSLVGKPIVGRNADGHLQIFEVDGAGELRQRWQKKSNGDWSAWAALGRPFLPGIAVVTGVDGRLQIFAVNGTNHALEYITQQNTNSSEWSDWINLGGDICAPIAAAENADGRTEVFGVSASSNTVRHIWRITPNGNWSQWADMGGNLQPGLVVAANQDGRLELFGIENEGQSLAHCWQKHAGGTDGWSDWESLGRAVQPGFALGRNAIGRLEVFAVSATNSRIVRTIELVPSVSDRWTSWQDFGNDQSTNPVSLTHDIVQGGQELGTSVYPGLAVCSSGDGRLELFAVDTRSRNLMHRWETLVNGSDQWSPWASMGIASAPYPAVGNNEDTDLEAFAVDPENPDLIHHRRQISGFSDWLDWSTLDHQTFQYHTRTWQSDEGLPDNMVQAIAQTADGFLWVGTRAGLARFDGTQFVCYDPRNTPALRNASITALCADRSGALWIGTDGGGMLRLKNGVFSSFTTSNGLAGDAVRVIYERRDGSIWIGTTTGMSCWRNNEFHNYSRQDGLLSSVVRSLLEDRSGDLWVATGGGLNRLRRNGTVDAFDMPNGLPNDSVRVICQDQGGRLWVGSNDGLLWYNWFWGNTFYSYNTRYGLSDTFVSAICEDSDGNLWVGTYSGLNRFRDGRFFNQLDSDGQSFDRVNALFEDSEGNLWVGSKEGLSRMTREKFFTYTKQQGLTHNNIMSVMQDRAGAMWIGTWGGGVDELQNEKVTAYAFTNGLSQDLVLSLCAGQDGSLWAGADFDGGLMRLKNGQATRYTDQELPLTAGLRVLHQDRTGTIWIGTDRGLACFGHGTFLTNFVTGSLANTSVRDICGDRLGALWFATQKGLYNWDGKRLTLFTKADGLPDNSLDTLMIDGEGTLWIGSSAGGLTRCRNRKFTTYSQRQGLYSDEILGMVDDHGGWLWMSCNQGIFRVRKSDLDEFDRGNIQSIPSIVYGKNDGMQTPQCNGSGKPCAWKSTDGRLWFPTSKGLVVVDPKMMTIDNKPPTVFIETVMADSKVIEDGREQLAGATFVLASRSSPLRVPPGRGQLEFQYSALDFSAPEKDRFQYHLEGADTGWIDAGGRRTAYYNNLAPGAYSFQVRACNQDGVWNDAGAVMAIVLLPHYWQTLWFRGVLGAVAFGLVCGAVLYGARRRMARHLAVLEQQQAVERERGRIAKDMHDQMGAGLTQIGLLGEFARRDAVGRNGDAKIHAEKITGLARELAQTLDEIVWAVNPRNDTLNKLGAYLASYAEEYFQSSAVRCRLDISPGLPAYPLSADQRHNLFLTVKEALNNIAKHSGASEARLAFALQDSLLEIDVEDNGVGFSATEADALRCGLANMRERIRAIGGTFEIFSQPGNGTRICMRVPLKGMP